MVFKVHAVVILALFRVNPAFRNHNHSIKHTELSEFMGHMVWSLVL